MPTYTKETALYDTGKIATDINNASNQAKGYFTEVSNNGVFVHEYDTGSPQPTSSGENGVHISDAVNIIRDGKVVSSYGGSAIIGEDNAAHIEIQSDRITGKGDGGKSFFDFANSSGTDVTTITKRIHSGRFEDMPYSGGISYTFSESPSSSTTVTLTVTVRSPQALYPEYVTLRHDIDFTRGTSATKTKSITVVDDDGSTTYNFILTATYNGDKAFSAIRFTTNPAQGLTSSTITIDGTYRTSAIAPSFIIGNGTATGAYGVSAGNNTQANAISLFACGKYNSSTSGDVFEVGCGSYDSTRMNAFRVTDAGNAIVKSKLSAAELSVTNKATLGALDGGIFEVTTHSSTSASTSANSNRDATISLSKTGYTPLGVVGFNITSSSGANAGYANLMRCYLSARGNGSGTVTFVYRNTATSSMTATLTVSILWLKTTA